MDAAAAAAAAVSEVELEVEVEVARYHVVCFRGRRRTNNVSKPRPSHPVFVLPRPSGSPLLLSATKSVLRALGSYQSALGPYWTL